MKTYCCVSMTVLALTLAGCDATPSPEKMVKPQGVAKDPVAVMDPQQPVKIERARDESPTVKDKVEPVKDERKEAARKLVESRRAELAKAKQAAEALTSQAKQYRTASDAKAQELAQAEKIYNATPGIQNSGAPLAGSAQALEDRQAYRDRLQASLRAARIRTEYEGLVKNAIEWEQKAKEAVKALDEIQAAVRRAEETAVLLGLVLPQETSPPRTNNFVGRWRILTDTGVISSYFTLTSKMTASRDHVPGDSGTWEMVGDEVRITYSDGWLCILRPSDKARVIAYGPGTKWDALPSKPVGTWQAEKEPQK
jgi:hypothetical protein